MTTDWHRLAECEADPHIDPAPVPYTATNDEDWDARPHGGRTREEWIEHALRRAADRRHLAQFEMAGGNLEAAQLLIRSALVRELDVASLRGEQTPEQAEVAHELVATWTGTRVEELMTTARAIVATAGELL